MIWRKCCVNSGSRRHCNFQWKVLKCCEGLFTRLTLSIDVVSATPPLRHAQVAATCVRNAHTHNDHVKHLFASLQYQHQAIRIASSSLDFNVLAIVDTFDGMSVTSQRELERQTKLLSGVDADLELISRVQIHVEFMSNAVRKAIEGGERHRTLGDYVSHVKMKQVAELCSRTHGQLYYLHCRR